MDRDACVYMGRPQSDATGRYMTVSHHGATGYGEYRERGKTRLKMINWVKVEYPGIND